MANISGYHVMVEMPNKSRPEPNFDQYADLCFWWSYNLLLQGNTGGAVEWWDRGFTMYNGTGFEDLAFDEKEFQTYKPGLCLWTDRQINYTQNGDFRRTGLA